MNPDNPLTQGPLVHLIRFLAIIGLLTIFGSGLLLGLIVADFWLRFA